MGGLGVLTLLGGAVIVLAMLDFLVTTVSLRRSGPIAARTATVAGRVVRMLPRPLSGWSGPTSLMAVALVWIVLLWGGWSLVFGDAIGQLTGPDGAPVDVVDVIAFSGSTISTMGMGVVTPEAGFVHVSTVVASITGMVVLTLAVSFILNVCQIAVTARTMALRLGDIDTLLRALTAPSGTALLLDRSAALAADAHGLAESRESFPLSREYDPKGETRDVVRAARAVAAAIRARLDGMGETDDRLRLETLAAALGRLSDG